MIIIRQCTCVIGSEAFHIRHVIGRNRDARIDICDRAGGARPGECARARAGVQPGHSESQVRADGDPRSRGQARVDLREQRGCHAGGIRQHCAQGREGHSRQVQGSGADRAARSRPLRVHRRVPRRYRQGRGDSGIGKMLGALVIVFREVIEAGLIIGIVLAATRGVAGRGNWVAAGVVGGALGAGVVALFAEAIANAFEGSGQELLNAAVLAAAVVMLMWHTAWMARHGREMAAEMAAVGAAVTAGKRPMTALGVVVGLAVLREGSEVVLFLYGILAAGTSGSSLFVGGLLGLAVGAAFTALTYYGLVSIPARHIFAVTTVLIALLAAGMAAQAVQYLDAAGVINGLSRQLWDSSPWLPQDGIIGRMLHTLIGYTDRPTELQLIAYVVTLTAMAALAWLAAPTRARRAPA